MGHNVSSVHGVKSSDFYTPGNAVNEIWVDNVELISRLPFGDSDLGQAGWPAHDWPKIPWHNFIIPLKRDLEGIQNSIVDDNLNMSLLHIIPDSCATPLILGIDNVWAPLLFMTGITIIGSGFVLLLAVASEVMDIHQLLRRSDRLPLRMVPQLHQPRNVRRWARDYLKPFVYDILAVIISMGLGFPIAVSSARCLDPLFTFSVIMISQAVFLLSFFGFCLFCFNRTVKKAATRNDGDEQDQAAETRLAQLEIDVQIATTITTIDQPPSASVDFDKAVESNPL